MKKIHLLIEWSGACSESDWARVLRAEIEKLDSSGLTKVTEAWAETDYGTTEPLTLAEPSRPITRRIF